MQDNENYCIVIHGKVYNFKIIKQASQNPFIAINDNKITRENEDPNNEDPVKDLIEELIETNKDLNNPLYFLNGIIIDHYYKKNQKD
jgi:hypothetical protein